jgi:hypothetical protein
MGRRHQLRFGLGDGIVLVALAALAAVAVAPHLVGRRLGRREVHARAVLERLAVAIDRSRVVDVLAETMASVSSHVASDTGLRPFDDHHDATAAFAALLEDDDYLYRVEVFGGGATARPKRPWASGRHLLATSDGSNLTRTLLPAPPDASQLPEPPVESELLAEARLLAITQTARATGLFAHGAAFQADVEQAAAALEATVTAADATPPGCLELLGSDYGFRVWPVYGDEWRLECYAWPLDPGQGGFAAFRLCRGQLLQSRNKVYPYDARRRPMSGAALLRPGARDAGQGFTGIDGNRWFPVPADGS